MLPDMTVTGPGPVADTDQRPPSAASASPASTSRATISQGTLRRVELAAGSLAAASLAAMQQRQPWFARLSADLIARRLLTESDLGGLQRQVRSDLEAAVAFAEASPFPDPKDVMADMFAA